VEFEWDENKNRKNIEKHGIGFEKAARIFTGPTFDRIDDRKDYGETRTISVGKIEELSVIVVIHSDRKGTIHIIGARPAKRAERKRYEEEIQKGAVDQGARRASGFGD
jgi:hypothetical protein